MSKLLDSLLNVAPDASLDVRAIRDEIHSEFQKASSSEERGRLLAIFKLVMDQVEKSGTLTGDDLELFQDTRAKDYNLLIVSEALIGENVCVEILDEVTQREVLAGRMAPNHELRMLAVDGLAAPNLSKVDLILQALVKHGNDMLASQTDAVSQRTYDFMPNFKETATQLYAVGTMWRYSERFELPTTPCERGLVAFMSMLMDAGMESDAAQARMAELNRLAFTADGGKVLAVAVGYDAQMGDGSLAALLDSFAKDASVSGAPYRMLDRAKPIAAIAAVAGALLAWLFGRSFGEGIGVGIVLGLAVLAGARVMYSQMLKAETA